MREFLVDKIKTVRNAAHQQQNFSTISAFVAAASCLAALFGEAPVITSFVPRAQEMTCNGQPLISMENLRVYGRALKVEVGVTATDVAALLDFFFISFRAEEGELSFTVGLFPT